MVKITFYISVEIVGLRAIRAPNLVDIVTWANPPRTYDEFTSAYVAITHKKKEKKREKKKRSNLFYIDDGRFDPSNNFS